MEIASYSSVGVFLVCCAVLLLLLLIYKKRQHRVDTLAVEDDDDEEFEEIPLAPENQVIYGHGGQIIKEPQVGEAYLNSKTSYLSL